MGVDEGMEKHRENRSRSDTDHRSGGTGRGIAMMFGSDSSKPTIRPTPPRADAMALPSPMHVGRGIDPTRRPRTTASIESMDPLACSRPAADGRRHTGKADFLNNVFRLHFKKTQLLRSVSPN